MFNFKLLFESTRSPVHGFHIYIKTRKFSFKNGFEILPPTCRQIYCTRKGKERTTVNLDQSLMQRQHECD